MSFPSLASIEDLEAWLGTSVDATRADAILSAASTLIRSHTGRVWVDDDGTEEGVSAQRLATIKAVCVSVAARVYRNPDGATQQQTGPFNKSVAAWSSMGLALTADEKAQLSSAKAGGIPGLSSVRVVAPADASASRRFNWWEHEVWDADGS